ncbi:MAG: tetratricopeptide repeat protein [Thermodesulfobacteriota bacterium]|jgi:tetratricopeptide (TPR) repeat protein
MIGSARKLTAMAVAGVAALLLLGCPPKLEEGERMIKDGNEYFKAGSYERAEAAYDRALELRPREVGVWVNRGNTRKMRGNTEGALADYEAALALDPEFAQAWANRGILRDSLGDAQGAIADYRKALELDPKLGEPPSIWRRIVYNPPTKTIKDRLAYLEAVQERAR